MKATQLSQNIKSTKFRAADFSTCTLVVKKIKGNRVAVVAYVPAGIQNFPEVLGVVPAGESTERYETLGKNWIEGMGYKAAE